MILLAIQKIIKLFLYKVVLFYQCVMFSLTLLSLFSVTSAPARADMADDMTRSYIFGGEESDYSSGLIVLNDEYLVVAGHTSSMEFVGASQVESIGPRGKCDVYVALVSVRWSRIERLLFIGGEEDDYLTDITRGNDGNLYLTGSTFSENFPVQKKIGDMDQGNNTNIFVLKVDEKLTSIRGSLLVGGKGYDYAGAIVVGNDGVYVGGNTASQNFPVSDYCYAGTFHLPQERYKLSFGFDAFVAKFNTELTALEAASYLGGDEDEFIRAMEFRDNKELVAAGITLSSNFPQTKDSYKTLTPSGGVNAFVSIISLDLMTLNESMVFAPTNHMYLRDMTIDSKGSIWLVGYCNDGDFPVSDNAFASAYRGGGYDGFIVNFSRDLKRVLAMTYLGGENNEFVQTVKISPRGTVLVGGFTDSFGTFPCTRNMNNSLFNLGHYDTFVMEFSPDLSKLGESILNGGSGYDYSYDLSITGGKIYLCGNTTSANVAGEKLNYTHNNNKKSDVYFQVVDFDSYAFPH